MLYFSKMWKAPSWSHCQKYLTTETLREGENKSSYKLGGSECRMVNRQDWQAKQFDRVCEGEKIEEGDLQSGWSLFEGCRKEVRRSGGQGH